MLCVSKAPLDQSHARATERSKRQLKRTLTTDPTSSANFKMNTLESDVEFVKFGTVAGFYNIYPEFIRNCDEKIVETNQGYHYSKTRERSIQS
jgi:hypothetical protein